MKRWKAIGKVGYFWNGPEWELGAYPFRWMAVIAVRYWLLKWSYSRGKVVRC